MNYATNRFAWLFLSILTSIFVSIDFPAAETVALRPYTHKVYKDLPLSAGVTIDETDRLIVWQNEKPIIVERALDKVPWTGESKLWTDGEFVESHFPVEYPQGTPGVNVRCSKHIRIIYGNHPAMTEDYVRGNLRMFEECLKLYHFKFGFPIPFESRDPALRDGRKYKVDVIVNASNLPPHEGKEMYAVPGCWGGWDDVRKMGYLMAPPDSMRHTPPSGATPHELAHACQMQGNLHSAGSGFWWEAHANWMMLQFINDYPPITGINQLADFYWGHGRHYYDCWQIFEHLKDEPGFGSDFVTRLWRDGDDKEYIWSKAERFAAPRSMADEWAKMARRNITWDYARHNIFAKQDTDPLRWRFGRVLLEPVPLGPSGRYRVPWAMAPQQFGYNICPIRPTARSITATLSGLVDSDRGSAWRASLVAVSADGKPRYSKIWSTGTATFPLLPSDREVYLVVSATPTVREVVADDDYRGPAKANFPYTVDLVGAEPLDLLATNKPQGGKRHPNGGGFVADEARVASTAYIGPHAAVLGRAQVLDHAHVGDYALITDEAVVSENARILNYVQVLGQTRVSGDATLTGRAAAFGDGRISGTAFLEGDYANNISVTKGLWFDWLKNDQAKVLKRKDLRGLIARYDFAVVHPFYAWDTYGVTHGLLVGKPVIAKDFPAAHNLDMKATEGANHGPVPAACLVLNGQDQYVELRRDLGFVRILTVTMQVARGPQALTGDQTLLEFSSADGKNSIALELTAPTAQLRLQLRIKEEKSTVTWPDPLPAATWSNIGLSVGPKGISLWQADRPPRQAIGLPCEPWNLELKQGFLGRGRGGNHFAGAVSAVSFYSVPPTQALKVPITPLIGSWSSEALPESGAIASWPSSIAGIEPLYAIGTPLVEVVEGHRYARISSEAQNGFSSTFPPEPIPSQGASIVVAVRPIRHPTASPWTSIVDVFYDRLTLGIQNDTGLVCIRCNGTLNLSKASLPDGRLAILSLIVQPDGAYSVYANGTLILSGQGKGAMTSLVPLIAGPFADSITVGRNSPDGWSTFNGHIGAVLLYTKSLTSAERLSLEAELTKTFRKPPKGTHTKGDTPH